MAPTSTVAIVPEPFASSTTATKPLSSPPWIYEVKPAHELPRLDLSITLKSRCLSTAARQRFDRWLRRRRGLMLVAYLCTTLLYIIVMVTPPHIAQVLSPIGLLLGLPGTFFILSALRYDAILVLLPTYDFVFFDAIVVSTLVVLMIMLHDARVCVVVQALVAYQINIFIDANIQAVRRVAIVNAFAMLMSAFAGVCVTLGVTPQLHHFILFEYGSHKLEARAFVTDGFITIVTIMLRNTYRKKALLLNRSSGAIVDCVSYRCHLTIQPFVEPSTARTATPTSATERGPAPPLAPATIQTMRYVASLPLIDAHCVMLPQVFVWLIKPTRVQVKRVLYQTLGVSSASLVIGVGIYVFAQHKLQADSLGNQTATDVADAQHVQQTVVVAIGLTCLYVLACLPLYQRALLREITSSFDFIFLSTQLTFVHVATADFFRWRGLCLLLVATWLWSHWVFCIDALTPVVRDRIGVSPHFPKIVTAALVTSMGILNHLLIFSDTNVRIYDRVLWSDMLLGQYVEFRLLASFYSTYVTILAWALRLLWRMLTAKRDEFVLLDGAVAYHNYLRQPTIKIKSRLSMPRVLSMTPKLNGQMSISAKHPASPTPILIETASPPATGLTLLHRDREGDN